MLIPMACSSSCFAAITLLTFVVWVLVLPRKVNFMSYWCIFMWYKYWFYPGNFLLFLSEDLDLLWNIHECPFHWCKKKWKFDNSGMYDVVSDHNFRQTFIHLDEVYLNQFFYYLWTILNSFFVNDWDEVGPLNAAWLWSWKVPSTCKSRGRGLTQVLLFMGKTVSVTCYWIK